MKNKLDERQQHIVKKVGTASFYVMFFTSVLVIVAQLMWSGSLKEVLGETIILLAGGLTCLAGNIRNGIWTQSDRKMSLGQNLVISVVFGGIFSVLYALTLSRKVNAQGNLAKAVAVFFLGVTVLGFLCTTFLGKMAWRKREKEERKYDE